MAIPVTPPSKKPFGNKKALSPILARTIPRAICPYSEKKLYAFECFKVWFYLVKSYKTKTVSLMFSHKKSSRISRGCRLIVLIILKNNFFFLQWFPDACFLLMWSFFQYILSLSCKILFKCSTYFYHLNVVSCFVDFQYRSF